MNRATAALILLFGCTLVAAEAHPADDVDAIEHRLAGLTGVPYAARREELLRDESVRATLQALQPVGSATRIALVARAQTRFRAMVAECDRLIEQVNRRKTGARLTGAPDRLDLAAFNADAHAALAQGRPVLGLDLFPASVGGGAFQRIGAGEPQDPGDAPAAWSWVVRTALIIEFLDRNPSGISANLRFWLTDVQVMPTTRTALTAFTNARGLAPDAIAAIPDEQLVASNRLLFDACLTNGSLAGLLAFPVTAGMRSSDDARAQAAELAAGDDEHAYLATLICAFGRMPDRSAPAPGVFLGRGWYEERLRDAPALRVHAETYARARAQQSLLASLNGLLDPLAAAAAFPP